MKYSRELVIALLGDDCFDAAAVRQMKNKFQLEIAGSLDIFALLLFFFVYESGFRPNRFLNYFCGIAKITDLKCHKQAMRDSIEAAFSQLAGISIAGVPFLAYSRTGNRWRYTLSASALSLRKHFRCELERGAFWAAGRRGVCVAYLGAYIYLLGICGKKEIDLAYLAGRKLIRDFHSGYHIWKARKTIRKLVLAFSAKGVFRYGRRLERLDDSILHVRPNRNNSGLHYRKRVRDHIITRYRSTVWHGRTPVGREPVIIDHLTPRLRLERQLDHLNSLDMDIRHHGRFLPNRFHLEYRDSALREFISFTNPVSGLRRAEWKDITFGTTQSSVLEIEHLRAFYLCTSLRRRKTSRPPGNRFLDRMPRRCHPLLLDLALQALFVYAGNPARARQFFRSRCYKYTHRGATRSEINSFFHFVTEKYFQLPGRLKRFISEQDFIRRSFMLFLEALSGVAGHIPCVVARNALIVPKGTEMLFLHALSESCRTNFGDKRLAVFKVTGQAGTRRYRFTGRHRVRCGQPIPAT